MADRDSLGELLLALCIRDSKYQDLVSQGFGVWMLESESCRSAWNYCMEIKTKGSLPSMEEISLKYKLDFTIPSTETLEGVYRRLRTRSYSKDIKIHLDDATNEIRLGNPEKALAKLLEVNKLKAKYADKKRKELLSYRKSYEERIIAYNILRESKGILGPITRWPTWNKETKGFQNGFFHVIAALTSMGKSWFMMLLTEDLLLQKRKPLVVSTEMAPIRLQFRLDCLRYKISHVGLRDATLPDETEIAWMKKMYEESLDETLTDAVFIGKKEAKSVQEVSLIAQDLGCTDVLIDGGYRLTNSREWGDQAHLVQEMQETAEDTNIPWTATVQLGDSSEKGKSFDAKFGNKWNIRYAKEWLIDPDVVALLSQPKDLKLLNQMQIEFAKIRDGDGKPKVIRIHWDSFAMNYNEISEEELKKELEESVKKLEDSVKY